MPSVRITGLVGVVNALRRELAAPLAPARRDHLRGLAERTLREAGAILQRHGASARDLPGPSRRALAFLSSIPWEKVALADPSAATAAAPPPLPQLSWPGVASFVEWALDRLTTVAAVDLAPIQTAIATRSRQIEGTIARDRIDAARLSEATREARGWLALMADPENCADYLAARDAALPVLAAAAARARRPFTGPLIVRFRPMRGIYRLRGRGGVWALDVPTPMIAFKPADFEALAARLFLEDRAARPRLEVAMAGAGFQSVRAELEALGGIVERTAGAAHDLAASFERVNAAYYGGALGRPRLTWSGVMTGRKFGHYDSINDTVMLSATLDQPGLPQFVVDYVMFHELLHKKLGVRWANGRRHAHTPEFLREERRFARIDEADAALGRLARNAPLAAGEGWGAAMD